MKKYLFSFTEAQILGIKGASYRTFDAKSSELQQLINEALHILDHLGIPLEGKTARRLERMALAFLALCDVKESNDWSRAKSLDDKYALKTREIIDYINTHFAENLSRGSYDDIRRKDLLHPTLAGIVISDRPESARNNPSRAWAISPNYVGLIRAYPQDDWSLLVKKLFEDRTTFQEELDSTRNLSKIPIQIEQVKN